MEKNNFIKDLYSKYEILYSKLDKIPIKKLNKIIDKPIKGLYIINNSQIKLIFDETEYAVVDLDENEIFSKSIYEEILKKMKYINSSFRIYMKMNKINEIDNEGIEKIIKSYLSIKTKTIKDINIKALNYVFKERNIDIQFDPDKYTWKSKYNPKQYFDKNEIQELCNKLENVQDKFIVYALWNGIKGEKCKDLVNLKLSDIAEDYSHITVGERRFNCDDYMQEILKNIVRSDDYAGLGFYGYSRRHDLNMNSSYVLKIRPTKENLNGLMSMNASTIRERLTKLPKILGDRSIYLKAESLKNSGIMFNMYIKEINENVEWTINALEKYLESNNITGNAETIYTYYNMKYHNRLI